MIHNASAKNNVFQMQGKFTGSTTLTPLYDSVRRNSSFCTEKRCFSIVRQFQLQSALDSLSLQCPHSEFQNSCFTNGKKFNVIRREVMILMKAFKGCGMRGRLNF